MKRGEKDNENEVRVELKCEHTTTAGAWRTTGIYSGVSAPRRSACRDWRAPRIIFCGCTTIHHRRGTPGTQRRCTWTIRCEELSVTSRQENLNHRGHTEAQQNTGSQVLQRHYEPR